MKHRCPICNKPTDSDSDSEFPFCSERCCTHDLAAWASEAYVVSSPIFDEEESERLNRENRARNTTNDTIH